MNSPIIIVPLEDFDAHTIHYEVTVEDLLSGAPPSFEKRYEKLRELAGESDSFNDILREFDGLSRETIRYQGGREALETVLLEVHSIYTQTQEVLARGAAVAGNFERFGNHLSAAQYQAEVAINKNGIQVYRATGNPFDVIAMAFLRDPVISLKPQLDGRQVKKLADLAFEHTPLEHFAEIALKKADQDDTCTLQKVERLLYDELDRQGFIQVPWREYDNAHDPVLTQRYEDLRGIFNGLVLATSSRRMKKERDIALGHVLAGATGDRLKESMEAIAHEAAHYITAKRPHWPTERVIGVVASMAEIFLNTFGQELETCSQDPSHYLHTIYRPKWEEGKIVGVESPAGNVTSLVPLHTYDHLGVPPMEIPFHFRDLFERYLAAANAEKGTALVRIQ